MAGPGETIGGFSFEETTPPVVEGEEVQTPPEQTGELGGFTFGREEISRETGEATEELRDSIEYNPEADVAFQEFLNEHGSEMDEVLLNIASAQEEAATMTLEELTSVHESVTLEGDFAEVGVQIEADVARILGLGDEEAISIMRGNQEIIFTSKEEALRYVYGEKVSFYFLYNFLSNLQVENEAGETVPFTETLKFQLIKYALIAWVGFSTLGSLRRGFAQLRYRVIQSGQRITAIERPEGGGENMERLLGEHTEYRQRREAIELAKQVFQGNERVSNRVGRSLFELFIDARLENVREGRIQEQSFWRNMYNIIHQRGILGRSGDVFLRPYYFNSRETVLESLRNAARIRQETIDYFTSGNGQSEVNSIRAFMELDHDVPNARELEIRDSFDAVRNDLLGGNLDFLFGMNINQAKAEVRRRLAQPILGDRVRPRRIAAIIGDGTNTNPGEGGTLIRNEVTNFAFITDISQYKQTLIARTLEARLNGTPYNPDTVRGQLNSFFASIGGAGGQNRYTSYSALSVIEKILDGNTKRDAINASQSERGSDLRARITDTDYLVNRNALHIEQVGRDIITRANNIGSLEELRDFQDNILDELRDHNDKFWPGFQSVGRSVDRIIDEKTAAGLPDTRVTPVPPSDPGSGDTERVIPPIEETEETGLRAQPIFDERGNLTPDARMLFEGNLALYAIDGNAVDESSINSTIERLQRREYIGQMLDLIERYNQENTLRSLDEARAVLQDSVRYQAQDVIERAITRTGSYGGLRDLEIRVQSGGNMSYEFYINNTYYTGESIPDMEALERQLISSLGIRDIPSSWDEISRVSYMRGIDVSHLNHVSFLRNIDTFFRRAR